MRLCYTFGIRAYYALIFLAQFFNPKAKKWIEGRKLQTFPAIPKGKTVFWFHCASLGEFDQGLPLMNKMKEQDSSVFLLVSFFSPSGFEHYQKRKHQVDYACYLPIDTKTNARQFLNHFQPKQSFFVKYEFWSNFIFEAKTRNISMYSICAIFRENHRFFKWYGGFFRKTLRQMEHFFVQNQNSIDLLKSIGITSATLVGDMRFDRVIENKNALEKDDVLEQFIASESVWVIGSSWSVDEAFLSGAITEFQGHIILAPHDISEKHLEEIEQRFVNQTIRYTKYVPDTRAKIIILDCIGKLASAYSYGTFAYVGGGFTGSLHNILEPAVFGLPVIFGPKHDRFPEAQLFIDVGVGFSVSDHESLNKSVSFINEQRVTLKQKTVFLVEKNKGAAELIFKQLINKS